MWQKISSGPLRNLNRFTVGGMVGFQYFSTHGESNDIRTVCLRRLQNKREYVLEIRVNGSEAEIRVKAILGPHEFFTQCQYSLIKFMSPDKRIIASVLNKLKNIDMQIEWEISSICAEANIDLEEAFEEIPQWILIEDKLVGGLIYKNTRGERYSRLVIHHDHEGIIISLDISTATISHNFPLTQMDEMRNYLISKNIFTDQTQIQEIISKISTLTPLPQPSRPAVNPVIDTPNYLGNFSRPQTSTNNLLLTQSSRLQEENEWATEYKRFSNLLHGVKTERSLSFLKELSVKMASRNKPDSYYNHWLKRHHGPINNIDDLKFIARKERFYENFIKSDNQQFKNHILTLLRNYIADIAEFDPKSIFLNNTELVASLRRTLMSKRAISQDRIDIALLILAKYCSINETDANTLESIEQTNRVFVTEGHQHDIHSLIGWHVARPSMDGETEQLKKLLNPFSKTAIPDLNAHYIFEIARSHATTRELELPKKENRLKDLVWDLEIYSKIRLHYEDTPDRVEFFRRVYRLEKNDQSRLIENMEGVNGVRFTTGVNNLLKHNLSIEAFASLDSERQNVLTLGRTFDHILGYGIEPEKLLSLSARHLRQIDTLVYNLDDELPKIEFPWYRVSDKNLQMINDEIDQRIRSQAEANSSFTLW